MPVTNNNFDRYRNTGEATRRALQVMGIATMQVAMPACPVKTGNLRRSHDYAVSGEHVDIGVTADYGGYVHDGTSRQAAQPWLREMASRNVNSISEAGQRAFMGALQ